MVDSYGNKVYDFDLVPCGKCIGCKLDYARQWSIRCMLEASLYDHNYFVTLTYDDEHIRNLNKEDAQRFIASLRKHFERQGKSSPRYFLSGEYGSTTLRPHMHAILFNCELDDLKFYKRTNNGILWNSETLSKIWSKGHVVIGECSYQTCGYVARYCLKKLMPDDLTKYGFTKEFTLMSKRPGIGFGYFDEKKEEIYKNDKLYFNFGDFASCPPPKFFDRMLEKLDSDLIAKIKAKRKDNASWSSLIESLGTNLEVEAYLMAKFNKKQTQIERLKRCQI